MTAAHPVQYISSLLLNERLWEVGRALVLLSTGWLCAHFLAALFLRLFSRKFSPHHLMLGKRAVFYVIFLFFMTSSLHELGFKLSVLMGAAGILTVAVGFASQTSASNLISGLFLLGEGSIALGDWIKVGETTGQILSIDLLSVKLQTVNNLYVRIPNETLIKSEVVNITRFPIRRLDVRFGVAYKEDISQVRATLFALADALPHSLDEPSPLLQVEEFAASSINLKFCIWVPREYYMDMLAIIHENIKKALDKAGIEMPFNQLVVHQANNPGIDHL